MKKILIIPDSFKGTLSAQQICAIVADQAMRHFPECTVQTIPVADGGEGTVDCFLSGIGGKKITCRVKGPFFDDTECSYALLPDGTAVVETASCAGLPMVSGRENPLQTTTYGVGEMIRHAMDNGCRRVIVGLGGSCTNDCGAGAAAALGTVFRQADGTPFIPTGGTLCNVVSIEPATVSVPVIAMCDIQNPLYGDCGAAYVFAPQKGADDEAVRILDDGLRHMANRILSCLRIDVHSLPGGGAAGGLGAGMFAFCGAALRSGIETVLDTVRFDERIRDVDLVITGEGKLDSQSLDGKAVIGIAKRCKKQNVPVLAIVGGAQRNLPQVYDLGVTAVFPIGRLPEDFSISKNKSVENLRETADNIFRLLKVMRV